MLLARPSTGEGQRNTRQAVGLARAPFRARGRHQGVFRVRTITSSTQKPRLRVLGECERRGPPRGGSRPVKESEATLATEASDRLCFESQSPRARALPCASPPGGLLSNGSRAKDANRTRANSQIDVASRNYRNVDAAPGPNSASAFNVSKAGSSDLSTGGPLALNPPRHLKAGDCALWRKASRPVLQASAARLKASRSLRNRDIVADILREVMRSKWTTVGVLAVVFSAGAAAGAVLQQQAAQTRREPQFENEHVRVWKSIILPNQPLTLHRHEHGRTIVALKGGTLDVVDAKGQTKTTMAWESGKAYGDVAPSSSARTETSKGRSKSSSSRAQVKLRLILLPWRCGRRPHRFAPDARSARQPRLRRDGHRTGSCRA